jgi:hypothetical protein
LPVRRTRLLVAELAELANYLRTVKEGGCEVIVIDGSPAEIFSHHAKAFAPLARHLPVDRRFGYRNDKVNGIHTGVEHASFDAIILADDDIRYTASSLAQVAQLLDQFEVVRPQNFLGPLPWWARTEAARMLVNRATLRAGDYPGTCAFRRSTFMAVGHYDGDVLFDNEEIIRHFARHRVTIDYALDLFIRKRPPTLRKWLEQRPRQAYEDLPLRGKTALFVGLLPLGLFAFVVAGLKAGAIFLGVLVSLSIIIVLIGRARGHAARFFPWSVSLFAPLWVIERTLSTYWALYWFVRRGGYPFGGKLLSKGVGRDWFAGAQPSRLWGARASCLRNRSAAGEAPPIPAGWKPVFRLLRRR